ncbi:MAG: Na+/H+ antiporter NhaC family protein [Anaerovoracaceae bacterium]
MNTKNNLIDFRGGKYASLIPFVLFMIICIIQAITGWSTIEGFYVNAFVCLIVGMFLSKSVSNYFTALTKGMGSSLVMTAVICWIFCGVYATMLKSSGLVDGLVWLCLKTGLTGGLFVGITFLVGLIYSSATGTNLGTVTAMTLVLYPAGILLGAEPIVLAGAILSAGVFGDNFAPISDSTIVAAATLNVDVPKTVKSRLLYSGIAGIIAFIIFCFIGGGGKNQVSEDAYNELLSNASPKGLLMLIPVVITVFLAFRGISLIKATVYGMIAVVVIALPAGLMSFSDLFFIDKEGMVAGAVASGIGGFATIILLILMIAALSYIMQAGGAIDAILTNMKGKFINSQKRADITNFLLILIPAIPLCNGIVAEIVAGPLMLNVCNEYKISRFRAANFADAVNCGLSGLLPWGGSTLMFCALTKTVSESYSFVPVFSNPVSLMPYAIYPIAIILLYFLSAVTGIGFKRDMKYWEKNKPEENIEK